VKETELHVWLEGPPPFMTLPGVVVATADSFSLVFTNPPEHVFRLDPSALTEDISAARGLERRLQDGILVPTEHRDEVHVWLGDLGRTVTTFIHAWDGRAWRPVFEPTYGATCSHEVPWRGERLRLCEDAFASSGPRFQVRRPVQGVLPRWGRASHASALVASPRGDLFAVVTEESPSFACTATLLHWATGRRDPATQTVGEPRRSTCRAETTLRVTPQNEAITQIDDETYRFDGTRWLPVETPVRSPAFTALDAQGGIVVASREEVWIRPVASSGSPEAWIPAVVPSPDPTGCLAGPEGQVHCWFGGRLFSLRGTTFQAGPPLEETSLVFGPKGAMAGWAAEGTSFHLHAFDGKTWLDGPSVPTLPRLRFSPDDPTRLSVTIGTDALLVLRDGAWERLRWPVYPGRPPRSWEPARYLGDEPPRELPSLLYWLPDGRLAVVAYVGEPADKDYATALLMDAPPPATPVGVRPTGRAQALTALAFPTPADPSCRANLVVLYRLAAQTPLTYDFPLLRAALKGRRDLRGLSFAVTRDRGQRYLVARVYYSSDGIDESYDIAERLTKLVAREVDGSRPQHLCGGPPEILRTFDVDLETGALVPPTSP
jgi:hypothetical protein